MSVDDILDGILRREGGYVDHTADRGGATNMGITLGTLSDWRGAPVTKADVQALTEAEARTIYTQRYVIRPGFHRIDSDDLRAVLVDDAVLSGPEAAIQTLQRALVVPADGKLGPVTLAAANGADADALVLAVTKGRCLRFGRIVQRDPTQVAFITGWLSRALEFL